MNNSNNKKQPRQTILEFCKKNKFLALVVCLAASHCSYYLLPIHKRRPDLIERNRLNQSLNKE